MNRIMEFMENFLIPIADKLNNNRYLIALRDGFMVALPFVIFGSIFVVIANFPFLDKLIGGEAHEAFVNAISPASSATLNILGLFVIIGIGYKLAHNYELEGIYGGAIAVASFLVLTPQRLEEVTGVIPTASLAAEGLFLGVFTAFISVELYRFFVQRNWTIKMPKGVPSGVAKSFSSLIPIALTLTLFLMIRILFSFTSFETVQNFIYSIIQEPLTALGNSLPATIIAVLAIQVLWIFGLHGQTIVGSVLTPIWYSLNDQNLAAFQAGMEPPNVVTNMFINTFVVGMGGSGMTLVVIIMIFIIGRSRQLKELAKLGGPSSLFNVNEPFIFGLPIILNPLAIIPWVVAPVIVTIITYFTMSVGLVPRPAGIIVPWTTPPLLNGFLATGNAWQGAALQAFNMLVVAAIWWPFLKLIDKNYYQSEQKKEETDRTE